MDIKKPERFQPSFTVVSELSPETIADGKRRIKIPWPSILSDQGQIANHIDHIKWFAIDFGGELNAEHTEWTFRFEEEELRCVVRYLTNPKFNVKQM